MYQTVIVIGAARSGTNMLRDVLTQLPGTGTWPCDEINYLWRIGNARLPHDELRPAHAGESTRRAIRRAFDRLADKQHLTRLVEKTCANSLRVPFVDAIFPQAKYVFLVRDGRDVVASARKRWKASLDLPYLLKKAAYVPWRDLPYYALKYAGNRLYRLFSRQRRLSSWGPRFEGMREMLTTCTLEEVCAAQWAESVRKSRMALAQIDARRVHTLRYEDFVRRPQEELTALLDFLGADDYADALPQLTDGVSTGSVGGWRRQLDEEALRRIEPLLTGELARWGYDQEVPAETDRRLDTPHSIPTGKSIRGPRSTSLPLSKQDRP